MGQGDAIENSTLVHNVLPMAIQLDCYTLERYVKEAGTGEPPFALRS